MEISNQAKTESIDLVDMARANIATVCPELYFGIEYHRNTLGDPLYFDDEPWLIDIFLDKHHRIVIIKSVQCGVTEWMILKMLICCIKGLTCMYVLPTDKLIPSFVTNRIEGLMESVPKYKALVRKVNNKNFKRIGNGKVKIVGSSVASSFQETPAQAMFIDEYDFSNFKNLAKAESRLASTRKLTGKEPLVIKVSNPTIEGEGIDFEYGESDKREWHIQCDACELWQPMEWFVNVVQEDVNGEYLLLDQDWTPESDRDIRLSCKRCGGTLDRYSDGEWVVTNPSHETHGYHVTKLMTHQAQVRDLWAKFQTALKKSIHDMGAFYNDELGIAYANEGIKITRGLLKSCVDETYMMPGTSEGCIAGVDIGKKCHVQISKMVKGVRYKVFVGTVPCTGDLKELEFVLNVFGVKLCVIDIMPETAMVRKFQKKHPGLVYLCWFHRGMNVKDVDVNRKNAEIKVDRTQAFDLALGAYQNGRVILPKNWQHLDDGDYVSQMTANTRTVINTGPEVYYSWTKPASMLDHHQLADVYESMAAFMFTERRPSIMGR